MLGNLLSAPVRMVEMSKARGRGVQGPGVFLGQCRQLGEQAAHAVDGKAARVYGAHLKVDRLHSSKDLLHARQQLVAAEQALITERLRCHTTLRIRSDLTTWLMWHQG